MKRRVDSEASESPEYHLSSDTSADEEEIDVVSPQPQLTPPSAKRFKSEPLAPLSRSGVHLVVGAGPVLEIVEQPRQRGFRFRYPCEGPCHGELRGEHSEPRRKTYPTVRLREFAGRARVVVSLVCHDEPIRPHAHCLVGRNVVSGQCTVEIGPETNWTASFPRLSILHIPKKNAARVLLERYALARVCSAPTQAETANSAESNGEKMLGETPTSNDRMALELQLQPGSREQLAGGAAALASLPDSQRRALEQMAAEQARGMNLNVVRLCFQAFLPDESGRFTKAMPSCISQAIYDTKAASSSALRIYRLDRHSGSVMGGDEVFMLCDRVQKDDIVVRFYEDRTGKDGDGYGTMSGMEPDFWEADGVFSPNDVHRQSAIVFKTPPYWNTSITRPTKVWVALKRRSEEEMGEAQQFTYLPPNACQCSCHKDSSSPTKQVTAAAPATTAAPASPTTTVGVVSTSVANGAEMVEMTSQMTPMLAGPPAPGGVYYFGVYNTPHALAAVPPIAPMMPFYGSPALMPSPAGRFAIPAGGEHIVSSVK